MQVKDIPTDPILRRLAEAPGAWYCHWEDWPDPSRTIPFPDGTPRKLRLAKMRALHRNGLVLGCDCGCRGDWNITAKGWRSLDPPPPRRPVQGETWGSVTELADAIGDAT